MFFFRRQKERHEAHRGFRPTLEALEDRMVPSHVSIGISTLGTAMVGQAATPGEPGQAATGFGTGVVGGTLPCPPAKLFQPGGSGDGLGLHGIQIPHDGEGEPDLTRPQGAPDAHGPQAAAALDSRLRSLIAWPPG
jgi:hypothetical protein